MRSSAFTLVAAFMAVGCQGKIMDAPGANGDTGGSGGAGSPNPTPDPPCFVNENDKVRLQLAITCKGCHADSSNRPFFATIESFEDLLVYDQKYVSPGKPDGSYLVQLLEGMGGGAYKQMPLSGDPFVTLDKNGQTSISLQAIKDWITKLPPQGSRGTTAGVDSPMTRRLTAEELTLGMRRVLGLPENGLWRAYGVTLELRAPDAAGAANEQYDTFPNGDEGAWSRRFETLGGPNMLSYRPRTKDVLPASLQVLVQISQDWCSHAVTAGMGDVGTTPNPALFKYVTWTSSSGKDGDAIRKNIGYLYLRFLGDPASESALDDLYNNVFLKYEPQGASVAWTAVCSYLIRDTQFLTF